MTAKLNNTTVRLAFVEYARKHMGWTTREASDAFEEWLEERRMVAMTMFVHTTDQDEVDL